jgi:hypothetical protein
MGGPGGPRPPGGGVTGAAPPVRGVAEDRRAGARGETGDPGPSPLLNSSSHSRLNLYEERYYVNRQNRFTARQRNL